MSGKRHVLYIIAGLAIGEPLGGAERFGVELARAIDRTRFLPTVCAFWRREGAAEAHWAQRLEQSGIEVFFAAPWEGFFNYAGLLQGVRQIKSHLSGQRIDAIHSHFQVGSVAAIVARRTLGCRKLIRTAHITVEWGPSSMGFVLRQTLTNWVFPALFSAEMGVSRYICAQLDRRPGARLLGRRAIFVPNGIAFDRFRLESKAQAASHLRDLGVCPDNRLVGTVGRLTEQKGYRYLVEAIPQILESCPDTQFLIVGDGELGDDLQRQARELGVADAVIFAGSRQDIEPLLAGMDLFVLPSLWEGLPTVILEAMASSVPVVATDVPGTRELIADQETGWLVRPRDPADLANAVRRALQSPAARSHVVGRAIDTVIPLYSMSHIAELYQQHYLSAARQRGKDGAGS